MGHLPDLPALTNVYGDVPNGIHPEMLIFPKMTYRQVFFPSKQTAQIKHFLSNIKRNYKLRARHKTPFKEHRKAVLKSRKLESRGHGCHSITGMISPPIISYKEGQPQGPGFEAVFCYKSGCFNPRSSFGFRQPGPDLFVSFLWLKSCIFRESLASSHGTPYA